MRITEPKQEGIGGKINQLVNTLGSIGQEISKAIQEEKESFEKLSCVHNGILDFNLVEQDVKQIHKGLERDGSHVLGSYLVLNDKQNIMEIQTYKQSGEKTFVSTTEAKVTRVSNLPPEVLAELKEKGVVKLHLKLE